MPSGKQPTDVLDMAIAKSTDLVYTWYRDGTVSVGSSRRLGERVSSQPFSLPPGKRPGDVLALAIGRDDHVYAWYADGTFSEGTSVELDHYRHSSKFFWPQHRSLDEILGMAIAGSSGQVYTWLADGTVWRGTAEEPLAERAMGSEYWVKVRAAAGEEIENVVGLAIAGSDDHVFAWYGAWHGGPPVAPNQVILYAQPDFVGPSRTWNLNFGDRYQAVTTVSLRAADGTPVHGPARSIRVGNGVQVRSFSGANLASVCEVITGFKRDLGSCGDSFVITPRGQDIAGFRFFIETWIRGTWVEPTFGRFYPVPQSSSETGRCRDLPELHDVLEVGSVEVREVLLDRVGEARITVYPDFHCQGQGLTFPAQGLDDRYFYLARYSKLGYGFTGKLRSIRIEHTGPAATYAGTMGMAPDLAQMAAPAPAPPPAPAPAPPAGSGPPQGPSANPGIVPTLPVGVGGVPQATIESVHLKQQVAGRYLFEVDFRRAPSALGLPLWAGGWLYGASGHGVGGYTPVQVPGDAHGSFELEITVEPGAEAVDRVEVFLLEPGQAPFVKATEPLPAASAAPPPAAGVGTYLNVAGQSSRARHLRRLRPLARRRSRGVGRATSDASTPSPRPEPRSPGPWPGTPSRARARSPASSSRPRGTDPADRARPPDRSPRPTSRDVPPASTGATAWSSGADPVPSTMRRARSRSLDRRALAVAAAILAASAAGAAGPQTVSSGTSTEPAAYGSPNRFVLPGGHEPGDLVGLAIAGSNDHVYAWYRDGTVSSGTSSDLQRYRSPYPFHLPSNKNTGDIVDMAIGPMDHVYVWYRDGTYSSGTSDHLEAYFTPRPFELPIDVRPWQILGVACVKSDASVYAWLADGRTLRGSPADLQWRGVWKPPAHFDRGSYLGFAIASNDHVYAWSMGPIADNEIEIFDQTHFRGRRESVSLGFGERQRAIVAAFLNGDDSWAGLVSYRPLPAVAVQSIRVGARVEVEIFRDPLFETDCSDLNPEPLVESVSALACGRNYLDGAPPKSLLLTPRGHPASAVRIAWWFAEPTFILPYLHHGLAYNAAMSVGLPSMGTGDGPDPCYPLTKYHSYLDSNSLLDGVVLMLTSDVRATLYESPGCLGPGLDFPPAGLTEKDYWLYQRSKPYGYGFRGKMGSIRVRHTGASPTFTGTVAETARPSGPASLGTAPGSKSKASVASPPPGARVLDVTGRIVAPAPQLSGSWQSNIGRVYTIAQSGSAFEWTVAGDPEHGQGTLSGKQLQASWSGPGGAGSASGEITQSDSQGRATRIHWSNGVEFWR